MSDDVSVQLGEDVRREHCQDSLGMINRVCCCLSMIHIGLFVVVSLCVIHT